VLICTLVVDPVRPHEFQGFLLAVVFHELDPDDASDEESTRLQTTYFTDVCVFTAAVAVGGMTAIAAAEVTLIRKLPISTNGRNTNKSAQRPAPDHLVE
jgi:hypothetical protein